MTRIRSGDLAPDVVLKIHSGVSLRLSDFRQNKVVVLFFYPKDGTAICTREACAFREAHDKFAAASAIIIGISSDSVDNHRIFAARHRLPFDLASDEDGALRKAFGVPATAGLLPGRVTYVIDKQGVVRLAFSSQLTAAGHVEKAWKTVEELARRPSPSSTAERLASG